MWTCEQDSFWTVKKMWNQYQTLLKNLKQKNPIFSWIEAFDAYYVLAYQGAVLSTLLGVLIVPNSTVYCSTIGQLSYVGEISVLEHFHDKTH